MADTMNKYIRKRHCPCTDFKIPPEHSTEANWQDPHDCPTFLIVLILLTSLVFSELRRYLASDIIKKGCLVKKMITLGGSKHLESQHLCDN